MNAENKEAAEAAMNRFQEVYGTKYRKAAEKLLKDREALLTHFKYAAAHWIHLRTTNAIESTFATVRPAHHEDQGSRQPEHWTRDGLQAAGGSAGPLEGRQRNPPVALVRASDLRGWDQGRARRPKERRVTITGQSTCPRD